MKITPTILTLSQLFSSTNELFVIPAYQRRYTWKEKQLGQLFDDIHLLRSDDTHLLGSVVCLTYGHTPGINPLELVDGQQRITTLSIFLKVLQNKYLELGNNETADEISKCLVCKGIDRKPKNKLLLGDLDNIDYTYVMQQKSLDDVKNLNLKVAYEKLKEWVDEITAYEPDELNELYFKFINNVFVIRLDIGDAKDAYRLFETINDRGLKLNSTDIIKNFLLGHASTIDEETLNTVRENWKSVIVNLDMINTDRFFRQYMSGVRTYKVTDARVIDEFKRHYCGSVEEAENLPQYEFYADEDPEEIEDELGDEEAVEEECKDAPAIGNEKVTIKDFSASLKHSSQIYGSILNRGFSEKKINQHLFNLQRIQSFPSYIFLLRVFQHQGLKTATIAHLLRLLETFMLRRHVCKYRTAGLDDIFSKLVQIAPDNIVEDVRNQLTKELPSDTDFQEKFAVADFGREIKRAKYILEQIEYHLIQDKGEYVIQSNADVHLEHIIPQTIHTKKSKSMFGDWETYLGSGLLGRHKQYVNRIGNFALIAGDLNVVASNNPFESKLTEYQKSNIQLTKNLCTEYAEKSFNFEAVEERCKRFAELAVEIWAF